MSPVLNIIPEYFPVTLAFSKANPAASATEVLGLPQGNGFIVPNGYTFHPLVLSVKTNADLHEHIGNGGFETAGTGGADVFGSWTESAGNGAIASEAGAGNFYAGAKSAKLTTGADGAVSLVQDITVVPGYSYTFSMRVKGDGTNKARYSIVDKDNSENIVALKAVSAAGTTFISATETFVAPTGCTTVTITLAGAAAAGSVAYFDAVSVLTLACTVPTAVYKVADDGTALDQPSTWTDDTHRTGQDDAHVTWSAIAEGSEVTVQMITTANYLPVTGDVDCVLLGVLKPVA